MKKVLTSFMNLSTEVDEKTGNIISQNNKGNFLVMNTEVQGHLDAIKEYIATAHLK